MNTASTKRLQYLFLPPLLLSRPRRLQARFSQPKKASKDTSLPSIPKTNMATRAPCAIATSLYALKRMGCFGAVLPLGFVMHYDGKLEDWSLWSCRGHFMGGHARLEYLRWRGGSSWTSGSLRWWKWPWLQRGRWMSRLRGRRGKRWSLLRLCEGGSVVEGGSDMEKSLTVSLTSFGIWFDLEEGRLMWIALEVDFWGLRGFAWWHWVRILL